MNADASQVDCAIHGPQDETFVCQHIVASLYDRVAVGFHWSVESSATRPDAWCSTCEKARAAGDGEWTEELLALARVSVLCGRCYDAAKAVWLSARDQDSN